MRLKLITLVLLLLLPVAGYGQSICRDDETVGKCWQRIYLLASSIQPTIEAKPSAPDTPGSASSSAKKDFVTPFSAAIQSAQLDNKKQELDLTWNLSRFHLPGVTPQLQTILRKPEVFQGIQDSLTASGKTARIGEIEAGLNDFNDATFVLSFNVQSSSMGRRFSDNRAQFDKLVQELMPPEALNAASRKSQDALNKILQRLSSNLKPGQEAESLLITDSALADRPALEQAIQADAEAQAGREAAFRANLDISDLKSFADLVDNQPQLIATLTHRRRSQEVGPNDFSLLVSGEWGPYSLNGLRGKSGGAIDLKTFKEYVQRGAAKYGDRFKFSVEYTHTSAYSVSMPADGVDLHLPDARRLSASLTYGRRLLFNSTGDELARIDLQARYDDYSDDPAHQDRGTIDLTYTQKISDSFSLPLGVTYANHSEFLDQKGQHVVSAHFALHAKLFGDN